MGGRGFVAAFTAPDGPGEPGGVVGLAFCRVEASLQGLEKLVSNNIVLTWLVNYI